MNNFTLLCRLILGSLSIHFSTIGAPKIAPILGMGNTTAFYFLFVFFLLIVEVVKNVSLSSLFEAVVAIKRENKTFLANNKESGKKAAKRAKYDNFSAFEYYNLGFSSLLVVVSFGLSIYLCLLGIEEKTKKETSNITYSEFKSSVDRQIQILQSQRDTIVAVSSWKGKINSLSPEGRNVAEIDKRLIALQDERAYEYKAYLSQNSAKTENITHNRKYICWCFEMLIFLCILYAKFKNLSKYKKNKKNKNNHRPPNEPTEPPNHTTDRIPPTEQPNHTTDRIPPTEQPNHTTEQIPTTEQPNHTADRTTDRTTDRKEVNRSNEEVIRLHRLGYTRKEIQKLTGYSKTRVHEILNTEKTYKSHENNQHHTSNPLAIPHGA